MLWRSDGFLLLYTTEEFAQKQVRLFRYALGRGQEYPVEFLRGFQGYFHTDGYAAYGSIASTIPSACAATSRALGEARA